MSKKLLQIILGVFVFTYMYHYYPTYPKPSNSSEAYNLAEVEKSYPDLVMSHGSKDSKYVALTFDDGPDNLITPKVLDILSMEHVKATFFIVGKQGQANPAVVKRIVSEGHSIGNHSWSHPEFQKLNDEESSQEINRTEKLLFELTGKKTALFRPPYGFITGDQVQYLGEKGYKVIGWDVVTYDWRELSKDDIVNNIESNVENGSIILQHCAGGNWNHLRGTVEAIPIVIKDLKMKGYKLVTIPELLNIAETKM